MQGGIQQWQPRTEERVQSDQIRHRPQSVAGALLVAAVLPEPLAWAWWGLCCTGMRVGEFWSDWEQGDGWIRVPGAVPGGSRTIPLMSEVRRPECSAVEFLEGLRRASDGELRPEDARRTFGSWMQLAGIPAERRRRYIGFGAEGRISEADLAADRGRLERLLRVALALD